MRRDDSDDDGHDDDHSGFFGAVVVTNGVNKCCISMLLGAPSVTRGASIIAISRSIRDHPWSIRKLLVTIRGLLVTDQ